MSEIYFSFKQNPHYNRINSLALYDETKKGYYYLPYKEDDLIDCLPLRFGRPCSYHFDENNIEGLEFIKQDGYYTISLLYKNGDILDMDADNNYYPDKQDLDYSFEKRAVEFQGDQEDLFDQDYKLNCRFFDFDEYSEMILEHLTDKYKAKVHDLATSKTKEMDKLYDAKKLTAEKYDELIKDVWVDVDDLLEFSLDFEDNATKLHEEGKSPVEAIRIFEKLIEEALESYK